MFKNLIFFATILFSNTLFAYSWDEVEDFKFSVQVPKNISKVGEYSYSFVETSELTPDQIRVTSPLMPRTSTVPIYKVLFLKSRFFSKRPVQYFLDMQKMPLGRIGPLFGLTAVNPECKNDCEMTQEIGFAFFSETVHVNLTTTYNNDQSLMVLDGHAWSHVIWKSNANITYTSHDGGTLIQTAQMFSLKESAYNKIPFGLETAMLSFIKKQMAQLATH